jgi:uncharacterized protein YjbI with pentapeptide repeats
MKAMFLGKWQIFVGQPWPFTIPNGYASYEPGGYPSPGDGLFCVWYIKGPAGGYFPAGRETNIAFLLRSDGQVCFLLNNGQYVGYQNNKLVLVSTLEQATPLVFDPEPQSFPLPSPMEASFRLVDGTIMIDRNGAFVGGFRTEDYPYSMSQVTPPLTSLEESGKGDGLDLAWLDLSGANFDHSSFVKADFSNCNLTGVTFVGCNLSGAILTNADLTRTQFDGCTLDGALLTNCILTNTTFTRSSLLGTHLESATFQGVIFSGTAVAGAVFKQSDLTGIFAYPDPLKFYHTPLQPPSATNPRTTLAGCRLNQSLIGNDWSMLDLSGATILDLSSPLSSAAKPLIAKYAILKGLNNNNLVGLTLQNAIFDYAVLDGVSLNSSGQGTSDLTNASLILASMHGTNLTGAILKGANMTGAQLGSLSQLFTLPGGYEANLNDGPTVDKALQDQFTQQGITLSKTSTLSTLATGRVWQLNDVGNKIIYTIRLEGGSGNVQGLTVYAPALAASLVDVYMPDAVLTGANLHGVTATGAQFYGGKARVDGFAILENVEFNDANLSNVDFTQANLYGANLSHAQLFNAKFIRAQLSPSATDATTNLSNANLQGADFTGATLDEATLANAATAINVPTRAIPGQGGVYLFSLPYSTDKTTLAQYTAELDAATTGFILPYNGDPNTLEQYLEALKDNDLDLFKAAFLRQQPPIVISGKIEVVEAGVWQIVDGTQSYTLWTVIDESGATVLYVAPSMTSTQAGFEWGEVTLRWQASASADTPGQQWLLDNDSENPKNLSTGYVRFIVKVNGNVLDVYGTAVRVVRLGDKQQEQMDTETCNETILGVDNMNSETTCPNGSKLGVNQQGGQKWDPLWLRAAMPPAPPTCVPTDYQWCPPQQTTRSHTQPRSESIDRE